MKLWEAFMQDVDFPVGTVVITPSGRRAIVKKTLRGASKFDCFERVVCRYEGGDARDLVTLQPHQLRVAPAPSMPKSSAPMQLAFAFA